jgi:galactose mutarotase-like enzyme
MMHEIKNEVFSLKINSLGAEMTEFKYNGNVIIKKVKGWDKISPVLFPSIGITDKNGNIPKHGYVRFSEFEIFSKNENEIELVNKNDKKHFNHSCSVYVKYSLKKESLIVSTKIVNESDEEFNYSVGHHPAIFVGEKDYTISFEKRELIFQGDDIIKKQKSSLCRSDFSNVDTILLNDASSVVINLNDYKIDFSTLDFNTFGVWSNLSPDSDFVCIEPWCGFDLDNNMKLSIDSKDTKVYSFAMNFETFSNKKE